MVYRINYCTSVDFNPQDIANTLLALDEMELAVSDLKEVQKMLFETVSRLCAIFSIREILICVEAFDHMCFYWQDFPKDFQLQLVSAIG